MAKIPWYLWIIVGGVMFAVSYRIGESMNIFLYIGLLFLVVGIFKMLVSFILGNKGKKAVKQAAEMRTQQFTCPRCRAVISPDFYFCPNCGTRLRF
ncbi:zinc ribbon domain-containing protein [Candidatus Woesearchaeota archaeon]|nr:zinc ribbon domain-containing protein [Candidatus Woesearchaeota archaeon]